MATTTAAAAAAAAAASPEGTGSGMLAGVVGNTRNGRLRCVLAWGLNDDGQACGRLRRASSAGSPRKASLAHASGASASVSAAAAAAASPSPHLSASGIGSGGAHLPPHVLLPEVVRGLSKVLVEAVSCGSRHSMARTHEGSVLTWGWGKLGQLGHSNLNTVLRPKKVEALDGVPIVHISAGGIHSAAVSADGRLFTWGENSYGQLGQGNASMQEKVIAFPRPVVAPSGDQGAHCGGGGGDPQLFHATFVSCGGMHTAALGCDGGLWAFGRGDSGQLGIGLEWVTQVDPSRLGLAVPQRVQAFGPELVEMREEGGSSGESKLTTVSEGDEDGAVVDDSVAAAVAAEARRVAELSEGEDEDEVEDEDGGEEGDQGRSSGGSAASPDSPTKTRQKPLVRTVACGAFHTAAVTTDGQVWTWGKEDYGMLGTGHDKSLAEGIYAPALVQSLAQAKEAAYAASCGGWHTAILTRSGMAYTFGRGEYGRLGNGSDVASAVPTQIQVAGGGIVAMSAGGTHSMLVTESGNLFTFGRGEYGRLGLGTEDAHMHPQRVSFPLIDGPGKSIIQISCGGAHSLALVEFDEQTSALPQPSPLREHTTSYSEPEALTLPPPPK